MIAKPVKIHAVKKYIISLKYDDGTEGMVDLGYLAGKGVFKQWDMNNLFSKVYIDKQSGAISWNEIIQLCPNTLYLKVNKVSFREWQEQKKEYGSAL